VHALGVGDFRRLTYLRGCLWGNGDHE
jgi:hypothetical protein